ncbi:hypothetical protein [Aquitalea magnusonii]|jgi:hypothetical protein|uniref:hypothetical protein n=1 Tax=Aquitalea magnusonii TaxID=332411 RepID=UPI0011AE9833|nr:hypothetical protein [Aquitalea magnusonii]
MTQAALHRFPQMRRQIGAKPGENTAAWRRNLSFFKQNRHIQALFSSKTVMDYFYFTMCACSINSRIPSIRAENATVLRTANKNGIVLAARNS